MIEIHHETEIHGTADTIFGAIVDLRGYDRWLSRSTAFPGITDISADPITAGTTYVESEPRGVRRGTITEFQPPTRVTFHQLMTMKPTPLGIIEIDVTYTLTPTEESIHLGRVATVKIHWPLKLVQPLVVRQFRREGERTLLALKASRRPCANGTGLCRDWRWVFRPRVRQEGRAEAAAPSDTQGSPEGAKTPSGGNHWSIPSRPL